MGYSLRRLMGLISYRRYWIIAIGIICSSGFFATYYVSIYDQEKDQVERNTSRSIRICCLILTLPKNLLTRAKAVHETWGPRCDEHLFILEDSQEKLSPEQIQFMEKLPLLTIQNLTNGRKFLTQKTTLAFLLVYERFIHDFDWFVKADDDTYIIVENLRRFLSEQNPREPVTFGYNFKLIVKGGYHSGGASYALSQESLKRFYQAHQIPNNKFCRLNALGVEDVEIARCLRSQDVYPGNSLDEKGRELFHPLPFRHHFTGAVPSWIQRYASNPIRSSYDCCSDRTISFHYITPIDLYQFDFLLYKVHVG